MGPNEAWAKAKLAVRDVEPEMIDGWRAKVEAQAAEGIAAAPRQSASLLTRVADMEAKHGDLARKLADAGAREEDLQKKLAEVTATAEKLTAENEALKKDLSAAEDLLKGKKK